MLSDAGVISVMIIPLPLTVYLNVVVRVASSVLLSLSSGTLESLSAGFEGFEEDPDFKASSCA